MNDAILGVDDFWREPTTPFVNGLAAALFVWLGLSYR
jgi:hypothetical protein